jgi:hypothetical protein
MLLLIEIYISSSQVMKPETKWLIGNINNEKSD